MHFGVPDARRLPARLDARRPLPGHRRRRARVQAPARAARRADVLGRRRDEHRRRARGPQPRPPCSRCRPCSCCSPTATRTPRRRAARWSTPCMADRIEGGWGIPATRVDGSDALATLVARARRAIEEARGGGGPAARSRRVTLRLDGHAAHDDGSYMDQERLADYVAQRDPIERLAARLRLDGLCGRRGRGAARGRRRRGRRRAGGGRGVAGARPGDAPRRRLRDEADDEPTRAAIAERVRAFVRDVVIPREARDDGVRARPGAGAARASCRRPPAPPGCSRRTSAPSSAGSGSTCAARRRCSRRPATACSARWRSTARRPTRATCTCSRLVASPEQQERYLRPLARGRDRARRSR